MTVLPPTDEGLHIAAAALRAGEIVAYPTETVYGLGVDPFNAAAVARLFDAKGRQPDHPVLLVVADTEQLRTVAAEVSDRAQACIRAFWPGPLSLLFPKKPGLPFAITAGQANVCVRCPSSDIARALCRAFRAPVTSTSANESGRPPAQSLDEISLPDVAYGIDGGRLKPSAPSTVYDPELGRVLRPGVIPEADLRNISHPS